jgi:hypothetical protein
MTDRDKKLLIGMGVFVGVALIWFFFLRGGGGSETAAPVVSGAPSGVAVSGTPGAVAPSGSPVSAPPPVPGANLALGGRDPFSPLPVAPSPSPGDTTSPGASPTPSKSPKPKDTTDVTGDTVQLTDVLNSGSSVNVTINGKKYKNVASGSHFGPGDYYLVRAIVDPCADFRYEKKSTTDNFTLCIH